MKRLEDGFSRRDLLKYTSTGDALLATGNLLAACGSSGETDNRTMNSGPAETPGPSSEGSAVRGGTLTVGVPSNGSSETVDVRKAIVTPDAIRVQAIYDPLFFVVPGGTAPGLAESAEPNADATKWTLKLRDGVTWHDGKPLTADDVVYTMRSSWGSKESNYGGQTKALVDLKNVRKIDQRTVEVPLLRPFAAFEAFASFYTSYRRPGRNDRLLQAGRHRTVQSGSFHPGARSSFPSNPDYWRGKPFVDELVVDSSFTDDPARINALVGGQIDIAPNVPPALAKANASSGRVVLGNAHGPAFIAVAMRVNVPPFDDPTIRGFCRRSSSPSTGRPSSRRPSTATRRWATTQRARPSSTGHQTSSRSTIRRRPSPCSKPPATRASRYPS
jgi:peptide/nickel transport system substrate-binding protein